VAEEPRRRLLRRGSIPLVVHGLLEYALGALFIASSSLFSFDSDAATVVSVLIGAVLLVMAGLTDTPTALVRRLPLDSHIVLDYVVGLLAVASPFLFGFSDDGAALAFFLIVGIAHVLLTVMTRFRGRGEPD
jgi:SPW repeat